LLGEQRPDFRAGRRARDQPVAATVSPAGVELTRTADPVASWAVGVGWQADTRHAITVNFLALLGSLLG
jgi:hypothetical protein